MTIKLKDKYQTKLDEYFDKLLKLGVKLNECQHINENSTSKEYKQTCIDIVNHDIYVVKKNINYILLSIAQDECLDKIF